MTEEQLPEAKRVEFQVGMPRVAELPPAAYANYVAVSHSEFEVVLDFAQIALPLAEQEFEDLKGNNLIVAKPVARIAIPHVLLPRMITALEARMKVIGATGPEDQGKAEDTA